MYIVTEASAHMPSSCKGFYRWVRVVQLDQWAAAHGFIPPDVRSKHILRVVAQWRAPAAGKTMKSGIMQARKAATELAYQLNNSADQATAEQIIGAGGSA